MKCACGLWDGCTQHDSDNLEYVQLEAGRLVTGLDVFASQLYILKQAAIC